MPLIGRPKTHWAGDNFVVWSGVLRHINMARWNLSVSSLPLASVLSIIIRFDVLTPTSSLQLLCWKATDERRVMGVGGALGCDGAVRLHGAHRSLILCMAGVIPCQNIEHSARDSIHQAQHVTR